MAKFVLLCVLMVGGSLVIAEEDSPLADMAAAFLQNLSEGGGGGGAGGAGGLAALGSLVGSLVQGDGAQGLGALLGQAGAGGGGGGAADMLSGLGSLLASQDGKIDPNMVGSMISMFAQQMSGAAERPAAAGKKRSARRTDDSDLSGLLSAAGALFEGQNAAGFLPVIMSTLSSFSGPQAEERENHHHDHAWFLPPVLEKLHVYWDHFLSSELGRAVWQRSGLGDATRAFQGADGRLDLEEMLKGLENHSFRRRWIKSATSHLAGYAVHLASPDVQQRYLSSAQYLINGFLSSQGFPQHTMFNPARAADSVSSLANHVIKKYFNVDTDMSVYVNPAFTYLQQILKMAQTHGRSLLSQSERDALTDRLTDTLNLEVIEPVLRVYRAYRHSVSSPHCREHLMCLVNRHDGSQKLGLPGFKAGLTKLASLVASAALSYRGGDGFWDLYNAVQQDANCEAKYPADCRAFHEHEEKVTTEYYHNEL